MLINILSKMKRDNTFDFYLAILLSLIIYFLWLFKTYLGNHHSAYYSLWDYNIDNLKFTNDYFIQNTNQFKISLIWPIHKFLKVDFNNDIVGFLIHITVSSISGFFLYKILNENFKIKDFFEKLIVLFSILTIGKMMIGGNIVSWVVGHTATPTYFSHTLMIAFIYFYLNNKNQLILFLLSALLMLCQLRVAWFPIGVCIFHTIFFEKKNSNKVWILGSFGALIYLVGLTDQSNSYEEKIKIFRNVLSHSKFEADFNLQKNYKQILLLISFVGNIFLINLFKKKKIFEPRFTNFLYSLCFLSICTFLFGKFYTFKGYLIYPFPEFIALSFTRALALYQLFFWLLCAKFISFLNKDYYLKIVFYFGIFYIPSTFWRNSELEIRYFYGFFIFLIILFIYFLSKNILKNIIYRENKLYLFLIFLFFLSPGIIYLSFQNFKKINKYSFSLINKWTVPDFINENEKFKTLVKLRKCDDFILYDYDKLWISSSVAEKSQYVGHRGYNHFNLQLSEVHENRLKTHKNILNVVKSQNLLDKQISDKLKKDDVHLITNSKDLKMFSNEENFQISQNYFIVFFTNKYKKIENIKNCMN